MTDKAVPVPKKATGSYLYKYSGISGERRDWLREIILKHRLYIPTLTQLNDPADGRPKLSKKSADQLFRFLYNSRYGVLSRPNMSVEEQVKEGVVLDLNIQHHGTDAITRQMTKDLYAQLDTFRIYSLSKRCDNLSMWAKYAEEHSGYCLEFANSRKRSGF